jgi:FHA domain-containing protein
MAGPAPRARADGPAPMSVLRTLETKIADLVEGAFGRVFRSEITPVELARRLVREMDRHRQNSLSSTVVANHYVVWLSPADRRHFAEIEDSLIEELATHLLEHARSERLALPSRPQIELRTDRRLSLGECGIEASLVNAPAPAVARRAPPARGEPSQAVVAEILPQASIDIGGQRVPIGPAGSVIGRSTDADIVIAAHEVSRRHAQILPDRDGWTITDLGSTNGVRLNGHPLGVPTRLQDGDVIEVGAIELIFEVR